MPSTVFGYGRSQRRLDSVVGDWDGDGPRAWACTIQHLLLLSDNALSTGSASTVSAMASQSRLEAADRRLERRRKLPAWPCTTRAPRYSTSPTPWPPATPRIPLATACASLHARAHARRRRFIVRRSALRWQSPPVGAHHRRRPSTVRARCGPPLSPRDSSRLSTPDPPTDSPPGRVRRVDGIHRDRLRRTPAAVFPLVGTWHAHVLAIVRCAWLDDRWNQSATGSMPLTQNADSYSLCRDSKPLAIARGGSRPWPLRSGTRACLSAPPQNDRVTWPAAAIECESERQE